MTRHEVFEELAAGHALDALEPEDEQLFLQHLSGCALCERDLAAHQETAAYLADGADPVEVPPGSFDGIRAAIVAESGERVFDRPAAQPSSLAEARRRRSRPALVGVAAAAVLVAALAGSTVALRQDRVEQQAVSDRLKQAIDALEVGPGRSVPLLDGEREVAAVAVVQGEHVSLVVDGLAVNEPGTNYVLWEQGPSGGVRAVGTFDVRDDDVEVVRPLPLQYGSGQTAGFAISREKGDDGDDPPPRPLEAPLASGLVEDA